MYDLPLSIWVLVLIAASGFPAAISLVLYRGAIAAGLGRRTAGGVAAGAVVLLGGWLVVSGALAATGAYRRGPGDTLPWLPIAAAGFLVALLLAARLPLLSRVFAAPGAEARLVLPHTLRLVGVAFVIVMVLGHLPAAFALPAGLGDVAIGLTAPFVARRLANGTGQAEAVRFHLLGLLDLVVAGILGFLLLDRIPVTPTTAPLVLLPLALIPTVIVPQAVALHIVALRRLRAVRESRSELLRPAPVAG